VKGEVCEGGGVWRGRCVEGEVCGGGGVVIFWSANHTTDTHINY